MRKRYTSEHLKKYIAKKYWDKLQLEDKHIDYDELDYTEGYRIFLPTADGWCYECQGQHLITADTLDELLAWVSMIMPCDCEDCKNYREMKNKQDSNL